MLKFPIDDTTVAEIVPRNALGDTQTAVKVVENWSKAQKVQLNAEKCKVMVIDYKRQKHHFTPLLVDGKVLETVESAKILGVTISCNLKWNNHINDVIKRTCSLVCRRRRRPKNVWCLSSLLMTRRWQRSSRVTH